MQDEQARAKYLRMGRGHVGGGAGEVANDTAPAFTVTRGELAGLVREAVAEAIDGHPGAPPAALLTREQLGAALGCSPSMVDKLRKQGMPAVWLGASPRFEVQDCLGWLRAGGAAEKASGQ